MTRAGVPPRGRHALGNGDGRRLLPVAVLALLGAGAAVVVVRGHLSWRDAADAGVICAAALLVLSGRPTWSGRGPHRERAPQADSESPTTPTATAGHAAAAWGDRRALGYLCAERNGDESEFDECTAAIEKACAERGLQLLSVVREVAITSGDAGTRPAFRRALEQLAAGEAQTLVLARLGHAADTITGLPAVLGWFTERGRTLVAVDVGLDTSTEPGRLAARALADVGRWERERNSAHPRRGLEAARPEGASRGRPSVADIPELRDRIVGMRTAGMTLQAIADVLNREGVPTLRGGAKWRPSSVQAATGYRRPPAGAKRLELPAPESGRRPKATT